MDDIMGDPECFGNLVDLDTGQKAMAGVGKTLSRRSKLFYFILKHIVLCITFVVN